MPPRLEVHGPKCLRHPARPSVEGTDQGRRLSGLERQERIFGDSGHLALMVCDLAATKQLCVGGAGVELSHLGKSASSLAIHRLLYREELLGIRCRGNFVATDDSRCDCAISHWRELWRKPLLLSVREPSAVWARADQAGGPVRGR